jgi:putative transposase
MARPLRIEYPNAHYHVSNKSIGRVALFPGELYCQAFLDGVQDAARRFNVQVLAWCLLKQEYHLLVSTPEGNLSRFMRQVDGLYTQFYQRQRQRKGSVFRARYKSVLFQAERYLAPLSRYLHLLPRKIRFKPQDWPWSSLGAYTTGQDATALLSMTALLELFGTGPQAIHQYVAYMQQPIEEELLRFYGRKNLASVLGDARFRERVRALTAVTAARRQARGKVARKRPTATRIVSSVADTFNVSGNSILRAARGPGTKNVPRWVAMYLCQEIGGITLQKIASRFGLQRYGTVSTTIGKLRGEFEENPPLASQVLRIRQQLYQ